MSTKKKKKGKGARPRSLTFSRTQFVNSVDTMLNSQF